MAGARLEALDEGALFGEHRGLPVGLRFGLRRHDLALAEIEVVVARVGEHLAAIDLDDAGDEPVDELLVVRRDNQCAREALQELLEPEDGLDVEVIRGLVEQERAGAHEENAGERDAHLPSAGELADVAFDHLGREAEAGEDVARAGVERVAVELLEACLDLAVAVDQPLHLVEAIGVCEPRLELDELCSHARDLARAGNRLFEHGAARHLANILVEVAKRDAAIDRDRAGICDLGAHEHAEDGRLAGPVWPDEPHFFSREDAHGGLEEDDLLTVRLGDRFEAQHVRNLDRMEQRARAVCSVRLLA